MKTIYVVKEGELKKELTNAAVRSDGTIWAGDIPLLGITDPTEKAAAIAAIKTKKFSQIPPNAFTRLGDNPNGIWAGDFAAWQSHPIYLALKEAREREVTISLSSRGWGDYSPLTWTGDSTRPIAEIVEECLALLKNGRDVDRPDQSREEVAAVVTAAIERKEGKALAAAAEEKRIADLTALARETGKRQLVATYMTSRCMNKSVDCSFDHAETFILPDGTERTVFTCCH